MRTHVPRCGAVTTHVDQQIRIDLLAMNSWRELIRRGHASTNSCMDGYSTRGVTRMARTTSVQATISSLTEAFARQLASVVEQAAAARIQSAILDGLGAGGRGPGRPRKDALGALSLGAPRRKAPKQLCPVPGCKNAAAPVFGMV